MANLICSIFILFSFLSPTYIQARDFPKKTRIISTSLASDEIIYSLLQASSKKDQFDVYYSYIAYNEDYSNIHDKIPISKIFHINKESLFIKDPDLLFLSTYNKA